MKTESEIKVVGHWRVAVSYNIGKLTADTPVEKTVVNQAKK